MIRDLDIPTANFQVFQSFATAYNVMVDLVACGDLAGFDEDGRAIMVFVIPPHLLEDLASFGSMLEDLEDSDSDTGVDDGREADRSDDEPDQSYD